MSVAEKFRDYAATLTIPSDDRQTISTRCKSITKRLNRDFWGSDSDVNHSFYTGSYGRGTATRGCSDIDLIMELPVETYHRFDAYKTNGQSALLQAVKNSVATTYPNTIMGADGQVVVVWFSDHTRFEVVPAFAADGGGYLFPDSNGGGSWRFTNPKPEIQALAWSDAASKGNLKNLARLARRWRDNSEVYMGGLLVDTFCHRFMESWEHRDKSYLYYDYMTRDFFAFLKDIDDSQQYWIAPGSGQRVDRKGSFQRKAKTAYENALEAVRHEAKGEEWSANQYWRAIYGTGF